MIQTYAYGFPRIGQRREYKKTVERFWAGEFRDSVLAEELEKLQGGILDTYARTVDRYPCGEMTRYDSMLDTAIMVGVYRPGDMKSYYDLCRGTSALDMTKWFNTNYHYLVPDLSGLKPDSLSLHWNKPLESLRSANRGIPSAIGPFTFLKLSRGIASSDFDSYMDALAEIYRQVGTTVGELHIEEPGFVLDVTERERTAIRRAYATIAQSGCAVNLFTYYDEVDFLEELYELPVQSIGLDLVHGTNAIETLHTNGFPSDKRLVAGIVDGRNVWRTDIERAVSIVRELGDHVKDLAISNAGPLFHLPFSAAAENLDPALAKRLSFATERLGELRLIVDSYEGAGKPDWFHGSQRLGDNIAVQNRVASLKPADFTKAVPYSDRLALQRERLNLPLFPTTTIGSFPQTEEVRSARASFRNGKMDEAGYRTFIRRNIDELVGMQEELGLDVLVHGEFERTDMVEFFAQRLDGIATTRDGWVLSYGTRAYRPPIIYGDVVRSKPMTLDEITYAQSLTAKPVKGMLTGPVTIISWSFVRGDTGVDNVAWQIALALQDEIRDYEAAGIGIVQVDEPAFRERAPIKRRSWDRYFEWATKAFNLATNTDPATQIHTHMCYSDFGAIIDRIAALDFDVISIEASRSAGEVIDSFADADFVRQIGLGVWDIHSPTVPSPERMRETILRAMTMLAREQLWVNPDCGLKTRKWPEVVASLKNMVQSAAQVRSETGRRAGRGPSAGVTDNFIDSAIGS